MKILHVHDILDLINQSSQAYAIADLKQAIVETFGLDARFSSCSVDGMRIDDAVDFLVTRGKFVPKQAGSCCGSCGGS